MGAGTTAMRGCEPSGRCAHRNRPLRYDGRVVVTLYTEEILYLPVTTAITNLLQLTPEGVPMALARWAAEETCMARAAAELEKRGENLTSGALVAAPHISRNTACTWLRQRETGMSNSEPLLSVLYYDHSSTADNIPAVEKSAESEPGDARTSSGGSANRGSRATRR
jgi:hypothetical protein